jgi:hypothetical protein
LGSSFHCSVIGTCLTTVELRQILLKIELPGVENGSDHELHGRAVLLAGNRDVGSKLLQKALDRRHRSALVRFAKARNDAELRALWADAVQNAEIPGAYWAVLTHAQTTEELARQAFGEVHMLSHLVGAANRADIRRLRALEAENAALKEKVARQQRQLRDAVILRDATIANLHDMLGKAIACKSAGASLRIAEGDMAAQLIAELRRRLASAAVNRERLERRVCALTTAHDHERKFRRKIELVEQELRRELQAAEHALCLARSGPEEFPKPGWHDGTLCRWARPPSPQASSAGRADGRRLRSPRWRHRRSQRVARGAGRTRRRSLLSSRLCQSRCRRRHQADISARHMPYVALRSSGLSSFAAALQAVVLQRHAPGAVQQSTDIESIA